ncbi:MAG: hypothetical protein GY936_06305, partial [Ignavibacteriae bacterium]|nr:hypothetical protein [Ignavibacteriota bacterium]
MKVLLALIFLLGLNLSCDSVNPDQLNCDEKILVDRSLFEDSPNDSFDFTSVKIIDNCLNITIQYGGGCGDIELK